MHPDRPTLHFVQTEILEADDFDGIRWGQRPANHVQLPTAESAGLTITVHSTGSLSGRASARCRLVEHPGGQPIRFSHLCGQAFLTASSGSLFGGCSNLTSYMDTLQS